MNPAILKFLIRFLHYADLRTTQEVEYVEVLAWAMLLHHADTDHHDGGTNISYVVGSRKGT